MRWRAAVRRHTRKTRHSLGRLTSDGVVAGAPLEIGETVEIVAEYGAFYLNRFDSAGCFVTDTWHQTLDQAFRQAEYEFEIRAEDWVEVEEPSRTS